MSRDFTPIERYASNKYHSKNYPDQGDMWLQNITIYNAQTGETKTLFTDEEQEIRKQYRFLAITMSDHFLKLYYQIPEDKRERLLRALEEMVKNLQTTCEKGKTAFNEADFPETLKKWYIGKLDPDFYYSEYNDELFLEWCLEDFCKKYDKKEN